MLQDYLINNIIELLEYVSIDSACEQLNTGRNGLYKLLHSGEIKANRVGPVWKITELAIIEYKLRGMGINLSLPSSLEDLLKPVNQLIR